MIKIKQKILKNSKVTQDKTDSNSGFEHLSDNVLSKHSNILVKSIINYKQIGLPKQNQTIHYITKRAFNGIAILKLIEEEKLVVKEIYCVVYSINELSAIELVNTAKKHKITLNLLISDIRNTAYQKKELAIKHFEENKDCVNLIYAGSHAKLLLIKTINENYIISTSANLSPNSRIEQYIIDNNSELYNFHKNWIDELKNKAIK